MHEHLHKKDLQLTLSTQSEPPLPSSSVKASSENEDIVMQKCHMQASYHSFSMMKALSCMKYTVLFLAINHK